MVLLVCAAFTSPAAAADDVWALLKKPGHIVLLRHSNAPGSQAESNDMDFKDCSIQRNLDAEGRAQAGRIGDEFRKRKLLNVRLVSSQYCRAIDTAALMKLEPVAQQPFLNLVYLTDFLAMREAGNKSRAFMKTIPANQIAVLVTHVANIKAIAGVMVDSGEMAVVHFDPAGEVVVDGRIAVP
ncbi:MAG: hypothetical protein EXQ83_08785 [Xanthobacteraceae bacterium]|nr:hypothetical protein [Xanthobacteraceae bacterium]